MTTGVLSFKVYRGVSTPLHILAIAATVFRIYHRHQKRKLWWDDFWAVVSLFSDVILSLTPWLRSGAYNPHDPLKRLIVVYWLTGILFPLVAWAARISIGMSIARLVPPNTRTRWLLYTMNVALGLACLALLFQKIWTCTQNTSWHNNPAVQCYLGNSLGIVSLCTEFVADAGLIGIPLRMLWRVKLPRGQRRLILSIFASSVISTLAGVVYTTLIFVFHSQPDPQRWGYHIAMLDQMKAAIGLLVCNLLVVVTYLYCLFWKEEEGDDFLETSETRSHRTTPVPLTHTLLLTEISIIDNSTRLPSSEGTPSLPMATHI